MLTSDMLTSEGHLLGGRVRYAQPVDGYRTGIEPVLLAACVPAAPGQTVLEAGTGAGAGLLCVLARVPGVLARGIELDPEMAELARRNLAANGWSADIWTGDVGDAAAVPFDHAFANPPWHDSLSTASPVARRRLAKQAGAGVLDGWVGALAAGLREAGTLTLILPAGQAGAAVAAMQAAELGRVAVQELLPKAGRPAKLAIVQGWMLPERRVQRLRAVVLHEADGRFTPAISAVLRDGQAFPFSAACDA